MPSINSLVGESIRRQREAQGLSQGQLADILKVDRSYVSSLESGSRNPSLETLAKISHALEISILVLLEPLRYEEASIAGSGMPYVPGLLLKQKQGWKNKKWYHQRFDGAPYFLHMIAEAEIMTRRAKKHGLSFDRHFCFFEEGHADWYIDTAEIERITRSLIALGEKHRHVSKQLLQEYAPLDKKFYDACAKIGETVLHDLSNQDLIRLHDEFLETILERNSSSSIIDGFALGTDRLLEEKIKQMYQASPVIRERWDFSEVFSILTTSSHSSFIRDAEIGLFKLIKSIENDVLHKARLIREYQEKFFWIRNNYVDAHALSVSYFEEEMARLVSSELDIDAEIERLETMPQKHELAKEAILQHTTLDAHTSLLLEITEDFTQWQDERKKATMFTAHYASIILEEVSRRIGLPLELLKYLSPREFSSIFTSTPTVSFLEARRQGSVFYWDQEGHEALSGMAVRDIRRDLLGEEQKYDIQDFRGMTAALGKAEGPVKILRSVKEIHSIKQGDILVAVMTRPDYVPAMKKAAAIITDEGGITSHAAIVSRELRIPCVIGTKIATQVLRDNDIVQVNANHGLIKIVKRAASNQ